MFSSSCPGAMAMGARGAHAHHHCSTGFCLVDAGLLAGGLDVAGAHVGDLRVAVVEHLLHVLLGHDGGRLGDERRPVGGLLVDARLLALQQLLAQLDRRCGLELVRLVDGAVLLAQQGVLQAGRGGVLAADGDLLAVLVEHGDRGAGVGVVGRPDGVDVAVQRGVALLEERLRLLLVPRARRLERRLDARGRHHVVRALVELGRVAVGRVAAAVDDLGRLRVLALGLEAVDDHLALELADALVVERDVVVGALDGTVVRDHRDALGVGLLGDLDARAVEIGQHHQVAARRQHLLGDRRVLLGVVLGVLDVDLEAGRLELLLQQGRVVVHPAARAVGVRHDRAHRLLLAAARGLRAPTAAGAAALVVVVATAAAGEHQRTSSHERGQRRGPRPDHLRPLLLQESSSHSRRGSKVFPSGDRINTSLCCQAYAETCLKDFGGASVRPHERSGSPGEEACDAESRCAHGGRVDRDSVKGTQSPAGCRAGDAGARGGGAAAARVRAHHRASRDGGGARRHRAVRHAGDHLLDAGAAGHPGRRARGGGRHRGRGAGRDRRRGPRHADRGVDRRRGPAPAARRPGGHHGARALSRARLSAGRPAGGGRRPPECRAVLRGQHRVEQLRRRLARGEPPAGAGPPPDRPRQRPRGAFHRPAARARIPQRTRSCGHRPGGRADAPRSLHLRRRRGDGRGAARPRGPAVGDLRRVRPHRARGAGGRAPRPGAGARRALGGGLRRHPRGAVERTAAHHGRSEHGGDGTGRAAHAGPAGGGSAAGLPSHRAGHLPGRAGIDRGAGMKFNDGYWLLREGVTARYATQALDVQAGEDGASITVLTKRVEHRGSHLNTPTITVELSAPAPDVIAVSARHFDSVDAQKPAFSLTASPVEASVEEGEGTLRLRSGRLTAEAATTGAWGLRFVGDGAPLTASGDRSLGSMSDAASGEFMVERLRLPVGANVYGFGERFTPFVKNGQVVDTWNEDGGTASEQAYKSLPFFVTDAGYGVFVDSPARVSFEVASEVVSAVQLSVGGERLDYLVIYGPTPAEIVRKYTALTGRPALPPRWSFGLWLSTSFLTDYDEPTVQALVDGMAEREIPLSVFHFDCYWMRPLQWCDFEWDRDAFPEPEQMLQRLGDRGLRRSVWINPYIGQRSPLFGEAARAGYLVRRPDGRVWQWDMWVAGMGLVDFTNPQARDWFAGKVRAVLESGVDAVKTDFGERIPEDVVWSDGSDPGRMHNYYSYLYNRTVFDLLERRRGRGGGGAFGPSPPA